MVKCKKRKILCLSFLGYVNVLIGKIEVWQPDAKVFAVLSACARAFEARRVAVLSGADAYT